MKRFWFIAIFMLSVSLLTLTSCMGNEEEEELIKDQTTLEKYRKDIIGLWQEQNSQEYWRFKADGTGSKEDRATGAYWDESEDVHEEEAEPFQWYIDETGLMVYHSIGGIFDDPDPESPFKIESLTTSKMVWKGKDGTYHNLNKVNR